RPEAARAEAPPLPATDAPMLSILVVDDEPHILHYMRATLESWGHTVEVASDGTYALERALAGTFDVIICDLRMPHLSGREMYTKLARQDPRVAVREIPWGLGLDPRSWWRVVVESLAWRPHIIHAYNNHAATMALWARRFHNWAGPGAAPRFVATRRVVFPLRTGSALRRADAVIAVSRAVNEALVAAGVPPGEIAIVHDGIDPDEIRSAATPALNVLALGKPVVATDAGGLPEILPPDRIVPVGDAAALAQKVIDALEHPSPSPLPRQFTASTMAAGVLAVYRSLV